MLGPKFGRAGLIADAAVCSKVGVSVDRRCIGYDVGVEGRGPCVRGSARRRGGMGVLVGRKLGRRLRTPTASNRSRCRAPCRTCGCSALSRKDGQIVDPAGAGRGAVDGRPGRGVVGNLDSDRPCRKPSPSAG